MALAAFISQDSSLQVVNDDKQCNIVYCLISTTYYMKNLPHPQTCSEEEGIGWFVGLIVCWLGGTGRARGHFFQTELSGEKESLDKCFGSFASTSGTDFTSLCRQYRAASCKRRRCGQTGVVCRVSRCTSLMAMTTWLTLLVRLLSCDWLFFYDCSLVNTFIVVGVGLVELISSLTYICLYIYIYIYVCR